MFCTVCKIYLLVFQKNLERLRQGLVSGELWLSGIRPPGMEGPLPMPQNSMTHNSAPPHIPAGLAFEEGRLIVPAAPNFYQPNIQVNNHHHQHPGMRPTNHHHHHHQPPQPQMQPHHPSQMPVNNSQQVFHYLCHSMIENQS